MVNNLIIKIISNLNLIAVLSVENLALRQQLSVLKQKNKRPQLRIWDRLFWILLFRYWKNWKDALIIVKPDTVVRWHRKGFKSFWKWKSRYKGPGRPPVDSEIRRLVVEMAMDNPLWGAPRIHGELLMLGFKVSERTVSNLMPKRKGKPPSQTWRTFLKNHIPALVSIDFFTVPTANFRILYVLVVIKHLRRKLIYFNVTANPTSKWTVQQIREAFPWDTAPKYMIRDRGSVYGESFQLCMKNMEINEVLTAYRSPWQNAYVERIIGSIRRECLDHVIVLNDRHLMQILSPYSDYYNKDRTHYGLGKATPIERYIQKKPPGRGKIVKFPKVGGLHHRYEWKKAA